MIISICLSQTSVTNQKWTSLKTIQVSYMFRLEVFFMEMCFKILLLTKYSFDLPGKGNCIDRIEHFEN